MYSSLEIFANTVVLLGNFNPRIFTPDWLEKNSLIGPADAEAARQGEMAITSQISRFETEWFILQVLEERLTLESRGALTPNIKDLAIGIFSILSHLPLNALGINYSAHYKINTIENLHKIGDVLAPKPIWHSIYPEQDHGVGVETLSLRIDPFPRGGTASECDDFKRITAQPSKLVNNGIYFMFNNHFDIEGRCSSEKTASEVVGEILESHWQSTWDESTSVFDSIIQRAIES